MERFWSKVNKEGRLQPDGSWCWEWTAYISSHGYGVFRIGSKVDGSRRTILAHRLAYELTFGKIEHSKLVRHSCDNRVCCNVVHLEPGTHKQNTGDMMNRGRHRFKPHPGVSNGRATLNEEEVEWIRYAKEHGFSAKELAAIFGCTRHRIDDIVSRRSWAHI